MTMNERTLKTSQWPVKPWQWTKGHWKNHAALWNHDNEWKDIEKIALQWMKGHWRNHTAPWNHDNEWKDFEGITLPCETMTMNERTLKESHCPVKPWQWRLTLNARTLAEITLRNHDNEDWHWMQGHWQNSHCETMTMNLTLNARTLTEITLWNHENEFDIEWKDINRNHTVKPWQ